MSTRMVENPPPPTVGPDLLARSLRGISRALRQWELDVMLWREHGPGEPIEADPDGGLAAFRSWVEKRLEEVGRDA